jgi:hypothetical protein
MTVIICLNGRAFVSDVDWADALGQIRAAIAADDTLARTRGLAISDSGVPTAAQRRDLFTVAGERKLIVALLTTSRLARGIGAIFHAIYPEFRTFAPHDFRRALRHIGVSDADVPSFWATIEEANSRIGLETVAEIRRAVF